MKSFKEQQLSQQAFIANVFGMQKEQQLAQNVFFEKYVGL
jgi:hypothetical protein